MNEQEIREQINKDKVDWYYISRDQVLSEDLIRKFKDKVVWYYISQYQVLSEDFIREFKDEVNWRCISECQVLSEEFIREFKDKVNWSCISRSQVLSEDFIREFKDKVDWYWISHSQVLSEDFIREFKLTKFKTEDYRSYAKRNNLIYDDKYLYAFRSHNKNNAGMFKPNTRYDKKYFLYKDWHCDLNMEHENSFGLGVFNEGNVKVRVPLELFGTGVKGSNKARVWGFEIID